MPGDIQKLQSGLSTLVSLSKLGLTSKLVRTPLSSLLGEGDGAGGTQGFLQFTALHGVTLNELSFPQEKHSDQHLHRQGPYELQCQEKLPKHEIPPSP